jgi:hypothetical protein
VLSRRDLFCTEGTGGNPVGNLADAGPCRGQGAWGHGALATARSSDDRPTGPADHSPTDASADWRIAAVGVMDDGRVAGDLRDEAASRIRASPGVVDDEAKVTIQLRLGDPRIGERQTVVLDRCSRHGLPEQPEEQAHARRIER